MDGRWGRELRPPSPSFCRLRRREHKRRYRQNYGEGWGEGLKRTGRRLRAIRSHIAAGATHRTKNRLGHPIQVIDHVIVGDAQNGQPKSFQQPITPVIIKVTSSMAARPTVVQDVEGV